MADKPTTTPPPRTIRELLTQVAKGPIWGAGVYCKVFEIPGTDYLLRHSAYGSKQNAQGKILKRFSDFLDETTALTPVHFYSKKGGIYNENVGQPLLEGYRDFFSITKKVRGDDLETIKD